MILSSQSIRARCQTERLHHYYDVATGYPATDHIPQDPLITPFVERTVQGGKSYGLSHAGYDIRVDKITHDRFDGQQIGPNSDRPWSFRLMSGDFVLASSMERIKMPNDLICFVKDKSSWAREGLAVQNTVLEPGWEGYITLELSFHRPAHHITINKGDPIAQLIFQKLDEPTETPYRGKYQNQANKPIEAIDEPVGA